MSTKNIQAAASVFAETWHRDGCDHRTSYMPHEFVRVGTLGVYPRRLRTCVCTLPLSLLLVRHRTSKRKTVYSQQDTYCIAYGSLIALDDASLQSKEN